jgi:hypothetical protein
MNMDTKKIEEFGKKVETTGKKMMKIGFSILFLLAGFFTLLFNVVVGIILILIAVVLIGSAFRKKAVVEVKSPLDIPTNQKLATEVKQKEEIKPKKELSKKEKIIAGFAVVFLIIFLITIGGGNKKSTPISPTPSKTETSLHIGDEGFLKVGNDPNQVIYLATDDKAFDDLTKVLLSKDEYGLLELAMQGKVFGVTNGTKVKVIDRAFARRKVRIIQGAKPIDADKVGLSGWVPIEWVVPQF